MLVREGTDLSSEIKSVLRGLEFQKSELKAFLDSPNSVGRYEEIAPKIELFALDLMDLAIFVADIKLSPRPPKVLEQATELYKLIDSLRYSLRFFIDSRKKI